MKQTPFISGHLPEMAHRARCEAANRQHTAWPHILKPADQREEVGGQLAIS